MQEIKKKLINTMQCKNPVQLIQSFVSDIIKISADLERGRYFQNMLYCIKCIFPPQTK